MYQVPVHGEREPIPEEKEDVYLNDSTSGFSKKQKMLAERGRSIMKKMIERHMGEVGMYLKGIHIRFGLRYR